MTTLRIQDLRKSYGDLVAVDNLGLAANEGEILALLGPNGAGKSTTVQCIVGLLTPDRGTIEIDGVDARKDPRSARSRMSYVPEVASLYEELTPAEYLKLRGRLFDMDDAAIAAATERLLTGFGIFDRVDTPIGEFSKGMTQKVGLSAALLTEPKVLVLDEPLSGLDVETTLVFKEVLREFANRGGTILYCSHLLDVVETLADRIAVIDKGTLVAAGTIDELRAQVGTGESRLESLFQSLTEAADPTIRAREILG